MNRLQTYYEQLQLPVKSLFLGSFLIAIGSIISNPNVNEIIKLQGPLITTIANVLLYSGGIILAYFPVYVFIKLLSFRNDESNIVVTGIIAYFIFLVVMVLVSPKTSPIASYSPILKLMINNQEYKMYQTGAVGIFFVYLVVRRAYRPSKDTRAGSSISYFDKDTMKLVNALIGAAILGVAFGYIWPMFVDFLYSVMQFISNDVNNPMSMFAYGALDRITSLLGLQNVVRQEFWLSDMGGSWINLAGKTFVGDVNIWGAQLLENVNILGGGRYTSAYYVINIFAIPGYLLGLFSIMSNKKVLNHNIPLFIVVILVSMISGITLPIEILMLLTSPTLYFFHLFMTSFVFAILSGFSASLGFSYLGSLNTATPGNIVDLLSYSRNYALYSKVAIIALIGVIVFFVYFMMTRFYYSKMAIDVLNIGSKKERIDEFVERLGGLENISIISSTPTRIHVALENRESLNVAGLHRQGVTRIVETRQGFTLSIGSSAYMIQKEINRQLGETKKIQIEEVKEDES